MKILIILLLSSLSIRGIAQSGQASTSFDLKGMLNKGGLTLENYYYTVKHVYDIQNSRKSASKKQKLDSLAALLLTAKSDSFAVKKENTLLYTAMLSVYPKKTLVITDADSQEIKSFPFDLPGEVTANQAIELIENGYDKKRSKMEDGYLFFHRKKYKIMENEDIYQKVLNIVLSTE